MRIDFLGLHAFVAIAERGSFQHAAAHLNLSQTALSHRIRKLEEDLGVKLLSRTTREVSLTQAGLNLLPKVKETIESLAGSLDELRHEGRSRQETLSIGCLPTIASGRLPRVLHSFQERHPDVLVRIYDNSATEISSLVQDGTIAFGITLVAAHRWDFDIELLMKDPFTLVCPEDHPLATQPAVSWSDLTDEPLIRISPQTGNRIIIDDALGSREGGSELALRGPAHPDGRRPRPGRRGADRHSEPRLRYGRRARAEADPPAQSERHPPARHHLETRHASLAARGRAAQADRANLR